MESTSNREARSPPGNGAQPKIPRLIVRAFREVSTTLFRVFDLGPSSCKVGVSEHLSADLRLAGVGEQRGERCSSD